MEPTQSATLEIRGTDTPGSYSVTVVGEDGNRYKLPVASATVRLAPQGMPVILLEMPIAQLDMVAGYPRRTPAPDASAGPDIEPAPVGG